MVDRVTNLHLLENGGAVVGDRDVAVAGLNHLVHAFGTETGSDGVGDGFGGCDVAVPNLSRFVAILELAAAFAGNGRRATTGFGRLGGAGVTFHLISHVLTGFFFDKFKYA